MLRYYWGLIRRAPMLVWEASKVWTTLTAVATLYLALSPELASWGLGVFGAISPLWALVPVGFLFLFGLLRASYEEFQDTDKKASELEKTVATASKRKTVKDLLAEAVDEGNELRGVYDRKRREIRIGHHPGIEDWVHRSHDLVEAAFDKGEARHFLSGEGFRIEGVSPEDNLYLGRDTYSVAVRLWRLDQLIVRANSLEINPEFDPERFAREVPKSTVERISLTDAVGQTKAENEELRADNERLTAERNEFEKESSRLRGERDGQIKGRCIELTDDLFALLKETKGWDSEETMREYGGRLRDKVDRLRSDLMRLGWWNPREGSREKLEYPANPDDLLSVAHYVRNIGLGTEFR